MRGDYVKYLYYIFLAVILITLGFNNIINKKEETVVEAPKIDYITINAKGYCSKPGTYEIPNHYTKDKILELVGASDSSIYLDFEVEDGLEIVFYEPPLNPIIIEKASFEELDSLPGIGEVKANKILEYLEANLMFKDWATFFSLVGIKNAKDQLEIKLKAVLR